MKQILPGQARFCAAVLLVSTLALPASANARPPRTARAQFARAEKLRDAFMRRPAENRTRRDYQRVIDAYRRVYYSEPASSKAPVSVLRVADLLAEMGHRFDDSKSLRAAIGQYKFLLREYPGNPYRGDALFTIAQMYKDDLHDAASAKAAYQELLRRDPRSARAGEARRALAQLNPQRKPAKAESAKARLPAVNTDADLSRVTGIRYWSTADYSRVAVDLDSDVTFHSERLRHPDRVVFDLHWTRLTPAVAGKNFIPKNGLLKQVRVSEKRPGDTRVVLDVEDLANYSAFLLPNPDRLIIDIHGRQANAAGKSAPMKSIRAENSSAPNRIMPAESKSGRDVVLQASAASGPNLNAAAGPKIISDEDDNPASASGLLPPSVKRPSRVVIREGGQEVEGREARPTSSGDRSLIRALGLKIGKIVIDPGHGGHDTGTIGPHGLEEKNLVLDVGMRLGRLLEQRLGADVVYTRDDDTFVPLETRTAIANQAQADLFISIHANSSHDQEARGVETYYLNFTTSRDALEVAARENAISDQSIYQLQQLVKTIALQEKVEESREFAADVQRALYTGLAGRNPAIHDRGVKKAPFVVLIGAKMPSILAEISFVSNPQDERKLRSPAYRQHIALALYRGIARYASGLSGIKVASSAAQDDGQ
ncbi:MAG TPA: N-acetylmuramoyl-L-alanine amidase [Terriglobales bacterium]|nr:N-acetylmuramoyl-L-alanine amidase [Terriglobales bacterium]